MATLTGSLGAVPLARVECRPARPIVWLHAAQPGDGAPGWDEHGAIAAEVDGHPVGHAAYARIYGPRAECSLDVDDAYWHEGLPQILLANLCSEAAAVGIRTFVVRARASDLRLLALLQEQFAARHARDGAQLTIELPTAFAAASGWTTDPDWRSAPMALDRRVPRLVGMSTSVPTFARTRVGDVMRGPVITCGPETPIQLVAQTMAHEHVHAIVVTGIERTAWGVVTSLDVAAAASTGAIGDIARDVAGTEPVTVDEDTPLSEAARIMVEHQVNHLLVADRAGHPLGIVSTSDVAARFATAE